MAKTATVVRIKTPDIQIQRGPAPRPWRQEARTKWPYLQMKVGEWLSIPVRDNQHNSYPYALAKAWSARTGGKFKAYKSAPNIYTITRTA